ncbi:hypothetical protein B0H14DRAFT_2702495, partial [Mycena olivaceomarginata]
MTPTWLHKFSVRLLKTALGQEDDDEGGQGTAVALESAISKAAGGHLHKYWPIFLEIYLELKTQRVEVVVIGKGGSIRTFTVLRRSKKSWLRVRVERLVGESNPTARFFMRSPTWKVICDTATPYSLCMGARETIYYTGHVVVVHRPNMRKSTFGVASTYPLDALRNYLPSENME